MKIVCFIDSLVSGGAQRQMIGLAILLSKASYEVELVYYNNLDFFGKILDQNNVKHTYIKNISSFNRIVAVRKYLINTKPDVVISYLDTPNIIISIIKLIGADFKLIVSERNTVNGSLSNKEKLKYFLYRYADMIVPNSFSQEIFLKNNYPFFCPKLHTIINFVDTNYFQPIKPKCFGLKRKIISVGRINEQKNVLNYIDAVKKAIELGSNIEVDWYGRFEEQEYYDACLSKIKKYGLHNVFVFHNPSTDIINKYRSSDIFCLPSIYEGTPNVLIEAMSCGMPVLCSNVCDNSIIVNEGENGFLFSPFDVNEMSDKLFTLSSLSDNILIEMGIKSRELSLLKFSEKKFTNEYEYVINKIANR